MEKGKLGVIGGMGPQATIQFCQRIVDLTAACSDQEHLPMLVLNDTQMPDRTAALLSGDRTGVEQRLLVDARLLEEWGATAIAVTCNTDPRHPYGGGDRPGVEGPGVRKGRHSGDRWDPANEALPRRPGKAGDPGPFPLLRRPEGDHGSYL